MPSSVINSFSYDPANKILKIVYLSGAIYKLFKCSRYSVYESLSKARSKGTYLNKKIKGRFEYKKIYEPS
jgi:hypothetical protein